MFSLADIIPQRLLLVLYICLGSIVIGKSSHLVVLLTDVDFLEARAPEAQQRHHGIYPMFSYVQHRHHWTSRKGRGWFAILYMLLCHFCRSNNAVGRTFVGIHDQEPRKFLQVSSDVTSKDFKHCRILLHENPWQRSFEPLNRSRVHYWMSENLAIKFWAPSKPAQQPPFLPLCSQYIRNKWCRPIAPSSFTHM